MKERNPRNGPVTKGNTGGADNQEGWAMRLHRALTIVLTLVVLPGCATMIRGTEQQVTVNTNPPGANIQFSNGQSCQSPCTITSKRDQSLQITISKDRCQTQTATMIPTLAGAGVILGGLIDYGTGAVYDLQPNPLTVTLACKAVEATVGGDVPSAAPQPTITKASSAQESQTLEDRLQQLKNLREKDLISDEEYQASRKAALQSSLGDNATPAMTTTTREKPPVKTEQTAGELMENK
jgi:hypothetical protein